MPVRRRYLFGIVGAALVSGGGASAQDSAAVQSADRRAAVESAVELPTAPVTVDGIIFRPTFYGFVLVRCELVE